MRDGLQSPSARDPSLDEKIRLVHLMDELGIHTADVGLPGASARSREHIQTLVREMAELSIEPNVACRTLIADIAPAVEMAQKTGTPIEIVLLHRIEPDPPVRRGTGRSSTWSALSREAVTFAVDEGMPAMFVTEDTTRARPEDVRALYTAAIEAGAHRICICDTCGHATPEGTRRVVGFVKGLVEALGVDVGIDWHGHRDRGLGLINALAALDAGATRIHGTALGIGERAGNTEMDLLLVNLRMLRRDRQRPLDARPST